MHSSEQTVAVTIGTLSLSAHLLSQLRNTSLGVRRSLSYLREYFEGGRIVGNESRAESVNESQVIDHLYSWWLV